VEPAALADDIDEIALEVTAVFAVYCHFVVPVILLPEFLDKAAVPGHNRAAGELDCAVLAVNPGRDLCIVGQHAL